MCPVENHPENGCVVGALFKVLHDRGEMETSEIHRLHATGMTELGGLARMFALLLLIELVSLMGNYYG